MEPGSRDKLNLRQQKFLHEYLASGNATESARRAGYSLKAAGVTGDALLKNPKIARAIDEYRAELKEKHWLTTEWVIDNLKEVVTRSLQKAPVMVFDQEERRMVQKVDKNGEGVWQYDSQGANKALELLGKTMGIYTDRSVVKDETLSDLAAFLTSDELG